MATKLPPGKFFGQTQRKVVVSGLTFAESVYESGPDLSIPMHAHENAFFHFLVDGVCEEIWGRAARISGPSTLAFHPAGSTLEPLAISTRPGLPHRHLRSPCRGNP